MAGSPVSFSRNADALCLASSLGGSLGLEGLRDEYEKRRNVMIDALHRGFASKEDDVVSSDRSRDYVHLSTAPLLASFDPRESFGFPLQANYK